MGEPRDAQTVQIARRPGHERSLRVEIHRAPVFEQEQLGLVARVLGLSGIRAAAS
jgi:hypothetical protein